MNDTPRCSYGQTLCTPADPCVYCERNRLRKLVWEGAELHRVGALPNSWAVQEYLNRPEVKKILEGSDE